MAEVVGYKEMLAQKRALAAANEISVGDTIFAQSQDECARRIVKHMWVIFVLLPFVLGLLIFLLK
jgi:hypothetical protein